MLLFKLVWAFAVFTGEGIITSTSIDDDIYYSEFECRNAGDALKPRAEDYARGRWNLDWKQKVYVKFACKPDRTEI